MIRLPAGNLVASASLIGGSCKYLQVGRRQVRDHGAELEVSLDQMAAIIQGATAMRDAAESLGMVACAAAATDLSHLFQKFPHPEKGHLSFGERELDELIGGLDYLLRTFRDELDARPLFALSPGNAGLYDQVDPLFGSAVDDAFPSSAEDIVEAGKSLAVGRWTGAVMHLMRALEAPLAALSVHVGIADGANWNKQLNQIESSLRATSKASDGADEEQWAAEAASYFRAIKNAWRNHAMHGRSFYDEERSKEIFDAVRGLMRHLAGRLSE
ncbi:hypothetical protein H5J25_04525 [Sphingomonas aliaeris]|uniref:Uncharacterized protein n=2 Tax=Sphingomonas aliaeris TaxID=2759526 RepID=A0A974S522_9SPHN|nr:hypothetical protein H5J25_04525 [Sphingomonas aliaeris]